MKTKPILFSGPMVRAILAGTKTQTRRVVKPQPIQGSSLHLVIPQPAFGGAAVVFSGPGGMDARPLEAQKPGTFKCPYGQVGDRLWVRETFMPMPHLNAKAFYRATDPLVGGKWKPSIFMSRDLCRIDLEITGIRVERLNEISEADAIAEGCESTLGHSCWSVFGENGSGSYGDGKTNPPVVGEDSFVGKILAFKRTEYSPPRQAKEYFKDLWFRINGSDSWAVNPFVWVIEFARC